MNTYLDENLKKEIKKVFEPRYKRHLDHKEVEEIAENLTVAVEEILKFKWKEKYENKQN